MPDKQPNKNSVPIDWQQVRKVLQTATTRTRSVEIPPQEQALRDYLGEELFRQVRDLHRCALETRKQLGNVILLPGIMGSHLSVTDANGDEDHVWLNLWRIVKGDMKRLRLNSDGETNTNGETVHASGVIGWYYALALETLQAEPFAYDWRIDIGKTAEKLKRFIEEKFTEKTFDSNRPVHFVTHSMGGLVAREFIRSQSVFWKQIRGENDKSSRIVMLGTPNMGSLAAVKGLMGKNETANKLTKIDLFHSISELSEIINTFYGLYQLCPDKLVNPEIYQMSLWKNFKSVLFDGYLSKVPAFYQELLKNKETVDTERMSYIAGTGFETPISLKELADGDYGFETTLEGDGTVSHKLGLLEGVTTYYTDKASHADLTNDRTVLQAVKDILQNGGTMVLPRQKPVVARTRLVTVAAEADINFRQAQIIADKMRQVEAARKTRGNKENYGREGKPPLDPALVHDAEKKLLRSILGGSLKRSQISFAPEDEYDQGSPAHQTAPPSPPFRIELRLVHGSIEKADAPVIVIGHYRDLAPGTGGAVGRINGALSGWIDKAYKNGMIGSELGQMFFIPINDKQLGESVKSVIVAGLGQANAFDRDDLRYVVMNVALGIMALGYDHVATVMMGMNLKRFSTQRAIRSILYGINDAVERFPKEGKLKLDLHEINRFNFVAAQNTMIALENSNEDFERLEIKFTRSEWKNDNNGSSETTQEQDDRQTSTRLTIERTEENFSLSALVANAAIPRRDIAVQDFIIDSLIEKLRKAESINEQSQLGQLLYTLVMPEDFQGYVDTNQSLILQLNREAAAIPWELVAYGGKRGSKNFGIDLGVTRQFAMSSGQAPGVTPPVNNRFRVLVIADPSEDESLRLPGARLGGEQLMNLFEGLKEEMGGEIEFNSTYRIGFEECDIVDILCLIANEQFDLVHFAGHGIFDPASDAKSGWVFGRNDITGKLKILSAREIFRLRRVPRLVFANACFSAQLGTEADRTKLSVQETNRRTAGLAEAFFERGIENYIGAGWQVDDVFATNFAKAFYHLTIVRGKTLGEALSEARRQIRDETISLGGADSTWGAYQHYGDSNTILVKRNDSEGKLSKQSGQVATETDATKENRASPTKLETKHEKRSYKSRVK